MKMNEGYSLSGSICDEAGNQAVMLHMSCGEKQMNLHVEVVNAGYAAEHAQEVRVQVGEFLAAAIEKAAAKLAVLPGAEDGV